MKKVSCFRDREDGAILQNTANSLGNAGTEGGADNTIEKDYYGGFDVADFGFFIVIDFCVYLRSIRHKKVSMYIRFHKQHSRKSTRESSVFCFVFFYLQEAQHSGAILRNSQKAY